MREYIKDNILCTQAQIEFFENILQYTEQKMLNQVLLATASVAIMTITNSIDVIKYVIIDMANVTSDLMTSSLILITDGNHLSIL